MRVGTVCYATAQGLGYLAKSFYDAGVVTDVHVVLNGSRKSFHQEWFPGASVSSTQVPNRAAVTELMKQVDVMLFFETPFDWGLIKVARQLGVRTVLMPMYECMPKSLPERPDKIIVPSLLDRNYYPGSEFIPVPVDRPWKIRECAKVFLHNSGNGGLLGRNGTAELVEALQFIKSDATILIRSQKLLPDVAQKVAQYSSRVDVHYSSGTFDYTKLYDDADVFVFPEKFNGLSLPLQEAYASGLLVMATSRFPNTTYLPNDPLIPTIGSKRAEVSPRCNTFDSAIISPLSIAEMIDSWYNRDIRPYSISGRLYGEQNSWTVLKDRYMKALS